MKTAPAPSYAADAQILLVDDNRNGLLVRRAVLEEAGYRVETVSSGDDALVLFSSDHYDLVVTDYRMPRMSGAELIAKLRRQCPDIPVVLLSSLVEPLGLNEENTGADAVVAKSAREVPQLLRAVSRLLNRRARNGRGTIPRKPPHSQRLPRKTRAEGR